MSEATTPDPVRGVSPSRRHDDARGPHATQVERRLAEEWVRLNQDPSCSLVLQRWSRRHPCLGDCERPGDIVDAVDAGSPEMKDAVLAALIELFHGGHHLAGRIVLQAMLPKLTGLAVGGVNRSAGTLDDRVQVVLGDFWQVLSDYPLPRRPTKVAANLALDTLHQLMVSSRTPDLPLDPVVIADLGAAAGSTPPVQVRVPEAGIDRDCSLAELLRWAVARSVISAEEAELLGVVFGATPGAAPPESAPTYRDVARAYREVAERTGTSAATLRQRVHRAKARLTMAARVAVMA